MDNQTLDDLLKDGRRRNFWLKPVGWPKDHPNWDAEDYSVWTQPQLEVHFHENPVRIAVGDILIAYRVRYSRLIYVAERLPKEQWGAEEVGSEYERRRWPHYIKARNLTPGYGAVWKRMCLQPFPLAEAYNRVHPTEPARLGPIQRGKDKASMPRAFAEFLIRLIQATEPENGADLG